MSTVAPHSGEEDTGGLGDLSLTTLERLIAATEEKAQAELRRVQVEEQRVEAAAQEARLLAQRNQIMEQLVSDVRLLIKLIQATFTPTLAKHTNMLALLLEVQRIIIPQLAREGRGEEEINRLTALLAQIGQRGSSELSVTTGAMSAGQDLTIEAG